MFGSTGPDVSSDLASLKVRRHFGVALNRCANCSGGRVSFPERVKVAVEVVDDFEFGSASLQQHAKHPCAEFAVSQRIPRGQVTDPLPIYPRRCGEMTLICRRNTAATQSARWSLSFNCFSSAAYQFHGRGRRNCGSKRQLTFQATNQSQHGSRDRFRRRRSWCGHKQHLRWFRSKQPSEGHVLDDIHEPFR